VTIIDPVLPALPSHTDPVSTVPPFSMRTTGASAIEPLTSIRPEPSVLAPANDTVPLLTVVPPE
jgi:hypothetical protein